MRKIYLSIILGLMVAIVAAQTPQLFNYQAVIRNTDGTVVSDKDIAIRINILKGASNGTSVYSEVHNVKTSKIGLINLTIGQGSSTVGVLGDIVWGDATHFLKISIDLQKDGTFEELSATQLVSVPYALYAKNVENVNDADADPTNEIQDLSLSSNVLTITGKANATSINLAPYMGANTDEQAISLTGNILSITGNSSTVNLVSYLDNTDSQTLILSGKNLTISGGNTVNLASIDTKLTETEVDAMVSNNGYLTAEVDGSVSNEIQDLSLIGNSLKITNNASATLINLSPYLDNTDNQSLSLSGSTVSITNGGSVTLPDASSTNEIQDLSLTGNALKITNNASATTINLAPYLDNTDNQTLYFSNTTLEIIRGNNVDLSPLRLTEPEVDAFVNNNGYLKVEADGSSTNEIQDLNLTGNTLKITNNASATAINLTPYLDNTDAQTLTLSGSTLSISNGNSVSLSAFSGTDTDDQTLSLTGTTLSISDGNAVNLSSINTDNQTLSLSGSTISLVNGGSVVLPDASSTNEIQDLNLTGTILKITNNGSASTINLSSFLDNTDNQVLSIAGSTLSLSNGGAVELPDGSSTNEIQDLNLTGNTLKITNNASSTSINLSPYLDNTDAQNLSLTANTLTISGGNSVNLSSIDTKLTEAEVDAYVSNNGYLTGSVNGAQIELTGNVSGDLMYYNGADWIRLPKGSSGQVLSINGMGVPVWVNESLMASNNLSELASKTAARNNLGLGVMATRDAIAGTDISITSQTLGDILYHNGTAWVRLPRGTVNQVLTIGADFKPLWTDNKAVNDDETGNLKIVRGVVSSTGVINSGSGFTINKTGTGTYAISISSAFTDIPAVTITPEELNNDYTVRITSRSGVNIYILIAKGGVPTDCSFNFIAVGAK